MSQCYWENCTAAATKLVYRHPTDSEINKGSNEKWVELSSGRKVCDEHLEAARKEFPFILDNNEP